MERSLLGRMALVNSAEPQSQMKRGSTAVIAFLLFEAVWIVSIIFMFLAFYSLGEWVALCTHVDVLSELMHFASWLSAWLILLISPVASGVAGGYLWKRKDKAFAWIVVVVIHLAALVLASSLLSYGFAIALRALCFV